MRTVFAAALLCLALALAIPLLLVSPEGAADVTPSVGAQYAGEDGDIRFTALSGGEAVETTMADWLPGAVAGEMPASFEPEALKAQAVAARTYILHLMASPKSAHPDAAVCDDPACCKAHLTAEQMRSNWGDAYDANYAKILDAVRSTDGQYLAYEGEPIEALFHSSSAGMTEDAAEVWSARPYLVSVDSPETAEDVPNYVTSVTVSETGFAETIHSAYPDIQLSGESAFWLGAVTRDGSGRVETVDVGGTLIPGTEMRTLFDLRSTAFTLDRTDEGFLFTVTGYGHGVGMSQYGANVRRDPRPLLSRHGAVRSLARASKVFGAALRQAKEPVFRLVLLLFAFSRPLTLRGLRSRGSGRCGSRGRRGRRPGQAPAPRW